MRNQWWFPMWQENVKDGTHGKRSKHFFPLWHALGIRNPRNSPFQDKFLMLNPGESALNLVRISTSFLASKSHPRGSISSSAGILKKASPNVFKQVSAIAYWPTSIRRSSLEGSQIASSTEGDGSEFDQTRNRRCCFEAEIVLPKDQKKKMRCFQTFSLRVLEWRKSAIQQRKHCGIRLYFSCVASQPKQKNSSRKFSSRKTEAMD